MYANFGCLNNLGLSQEDKSSSLVINSCRFFRLVNKKKLITHLPADCTDFHLYYVAAGQIHFLCEGKEYIVSADHMVLLQPNHQQQIYEYFVKETSEVYWVQFNGINVKYILEHFDMPLDKIAFYCGYSIYYSRIFSTMINELQLANKGFQELVDMLLRQIFLLVQRHGEKHATSTSTSICKEIDYACYFFNKHYNENINIEDFAKSIGMSVSWFLKNFKQATAMTPMQYILNIRMNNAAGLLETTDYSVAEISDIIGYDNPLYFSRIFSKQKGISPSEYRKQFKKSLLH